jgi:hypothetical protein
MTKYLVVSKKCTTFAADLMNNDLSAKAVFPRSGLYSFSPKDGLKNLIFIYYGLQDF